MRKKPKPTYKRQKRVQNTQKRHTINSNRAKKNCSTISYIELRFAQALKEAGIKFCQQYRIRRTGRNKYRSFYADFAFPDYDLIVELDGKAWHTGKYALRDKKRQKEIEDQGWTVLRFTGSEIVTNTRACVQEVISYIRSINED